MMMLTAFPPRHDSIQFMKKFMVARDGMEPAQGRAPSKAQLKKMADDAKRERSGRLQEMAMEVAADDDQPFPAPLLKAST